jgi:putative flippase GtrA
VRRVESWRVLKYLLVGALVALVYYLVFMFFRVYLESTLPVSIFFAFGSSAILRFVLHKSWVFSSSNNLLHPETFRYGVMMALSYAASVLVTVALDEALPMPAFLVATVSVLVATVVAYTLSSRWVFQKRM